MKKVYFLIAILASLAGLGLWSFRQDTAFHIKTDSYLDARLDSLLGVTQEMLAYTEAGDMERVQTGFFAARSHYKKIEALVEYFFTESAIKLNGPALMESEPSMPGEYKYPTGFQVLEEALFAATIMKHDVRNEIENIRFYVKRIKAHREDVHFTPTNVLDALKLNLYRLIAKGIAGFDSPVILNSLPEAISTLQGTQELLFLIGENGRTLHALLDSAVAFAGQEGMTFDDFDRAVFIRRYINPVTAAFVDFQKLCNIPFETTIPRLIGPQATDMFDYEQWNVLFFAPSDALPVTAPYVRLGERLFFDKRLSVNLSRNCASCHEPSKAFTDGRTTNTTLLGDQSILRNTPTLINAAYQPAQFYDRRVTFLEDQIHDVVTNAKEMGGAFETLVARLNKDKVLKRAFGEVMGKEDIKERDVKRLIAAYIRSLQQLNTPFDRYMHGDTAALSATAVKGFNLFMGKAKCGTCHFMPLFNGTVPPGFEKIESEVLGVPFAKDKNVVDTDPGAYNIYKIGYQMYSFKTPTVRTSAQTAPYMHNGIYQTLDEVIGFYNHGGGAGLGIELEFQTLPPDSLHLTSEEQKQLKAFLEVL